MDRAFIYAGIITAIILFFGLYLGYIFDIDRSDSIKNELDNLDIKYSDLMLQNQYISTFQDSTNFCETSIKKTLDLAQVTYSKGVTLEQYEKINRFAPELITEKQKYAMILLRLWFYTAQLKEVCDAKYSTIAYFYMQNSNTSKLKTDQAIQSSILLETQRECGKENILIFALPVDLNITIIDILKDQYNITKIPTTIIDEKTKIEGRSKLSRILQNVACPTKVK